MRRRSAGFSTSPVEHARSVGESSHTTIWPSPSVERRGHRSQLSSDSFGGFVGTANVDKLDEPSEGNADTFIDDDEEWQDADVMSAFSPISPRPDPIQSPSSKKVPTTDKARQDQLGELDWAAWETPRGSSPAQAPNASRSDEASHVNDDFMSAYQKLSTASEVERRSSPPIIDLREISKKLDEQKAMKASGLQADDLLFFESFDNNPRGVMQNSRTDSHNKENKLNEDQLLSMHEAQASPLRIQAPSARQSAPVDYFGDDTANDIDLSRRGKDGDPMSINDAGLASHSSDKKPPNRAGSWSETAGSWAGSFRKTFGTLRGHLPTARDFYVSEDDVEGDSGVFQVPEPISSMNTAVDDDANQAGADDLSLSPSTEHKLHSRKLANIANYSQGTPFSTQSDNYATSPPMTSPTQTKPSLGSSGILHPHAGHHSSLPVSGAPGFDPNSGRNWNTGQWSLSSQEESARRSKPIPVLLKGRRDETQEVVTEALAAILTARLPKRHQLGKTWKLLYSSDQHGISLQSLYWKVQSGLDAGKQGGGRFASSSSSGGVADAEGWLRGASEATKAALTGASGVQRVGGGLSLSDAGLVLAIKDDEDHVFGAFVNERLRPQSTYYGNGECFLWKQADSGSVKTFPWTGRNDYMILTEAHYLSVGGGEGKYGLWLDGRLEHGVSSPCPAFDNDILCDGRDDSPSLSASSQSAEGRFECITLEVWACGID